MKIQIGDLLYSKDVMNITSVKLGYGKAKLLNIEDDNITLHLLTRPEKGEDSIITLTLDEVNKIFYPVK